MLLKYITQVTPQKGGSAPTGLQLTHHGQFYHPQLRDPLIHSPMLFLSREPNGLHNSCGFPAEAVCLGTVLSTWPPWNTTYWSTPIKQHATFRSPLPVVSNRAVTQQLQSATLPYCLIPAALSWVRVKCKLSLTINCGSWVLVIVPRAAEATVS